MDLVAYTVTGTGKPNAVFCGNTLQITVIICIFKTGLQCVMVYIGNT